MAGPELSSEVEVLTSPPPPGYEPAATAAHAESEENLSQYALVLAERRAVGYALGLFGIVGICALLYGSYSHIERVWALTSQDLPTNVLKLLMAQLAAYAAVTVAGVYFLYQVLRAAERMVLPGFWATRNVELARVMLGLQDPVRASTKAVEQSIEVASKLAEKWR
ncbi:MAG: hypothetical protein WBV82_31160 [Myxococcaceae bacterium]